MAFKKKIGGKAKKEFEIVGLIDLVFLLLIFFILTATTGMEGERVGTDKLTLPHMSGVPLDANERLSTLMFRIEKRGEAFGDSPPDILYALLPFKTQNKDTSWSGRSDTLTYEESFQQSKMDTFLSLFCELHFDHIHKDPACSLFVVNTIQKYRENVFRTLGNHVEISAVERTPFYYINVIMSECGRIEDEIPNVVFRTIYP